MMQRLTTDNPQSNFETLMNLAYAENREVFIRSDEPISLNDYVRGICECKCIDGKIGSDEVLAEMVMDCIGEEPGCNVAMLFAIATQAAELRTRLKDYEDAEEQGRLMVLPKKTDTSARLAVLNSLDVEGADCDNGECGYVVVEASLDNIQALLYAGFSTDEIGQAIDGELIDILVLAFSYSDATWWDCENGFSAEAAAKLKEADNG